MASATSISSPVILGELSPASKRRASVPATPPANGIVGAAVPHPTPPPRPTLADTTASPATGSSSPRLKTGSPPIIIPSAAAHRSASFDSGGGSGGRERSGSGSAGSAAAFGMGLLRGARDGISKTRDALSKKLQRTNSDHNPEPTGSYGGAGADGSDDSNRDRANQSPNPGSTQSWGRIENRMRGAISGVKSGLSGAISSVSRMTSDGVMGGDAATGQAMPMMISRPSIRPDNGIASLAEQELEHYCSGPRALAWTDFIAVKPEELSVLKGQSVALRKAVNPHWIVCTTADGASGILPQQCLTIIEPLPGQQREEGVPASERELHPTLTRADEVANASAGTNASVSAAAATVDSAASAGVAVGSDPDGKDAPKEQPFSEAVAGDVAVAGADAGADDDGSTKTSGHGGGGADAAHSAAEQVEYFSSGPRATALSDFTPNMLMGLRLTKGQSIALRKEVNVDWLVATTTSGDSGLVPRAHLLLIEDLPQS